MEGFKENISIIVILCFSSLFHCVTWYISEISAEICPAINNLIPINVTAFHLFAFLSVIFAWNCFYLYPCTKYPDIWLWIETSVSFFSTSSEPTCYISPEVSSWRLWICDEKIMLLVLIWNQNKTQRLKCFYHQETSNQNQYQNPREKSKYIYLYIHQAQRSISDVN